MARPTEARQAQEAPQLLPLPSPVIEHHEAVLLGPMKEWLATKKIPPVLLLTGATGVGKRAIAHHLSQWLLCEKTGFAKAGGDTDDQTPNMFGDLLGEPRIQTPAETDEAPLRPCGACVNCQRASHGTWVDFTEITPEDEGSETLKIDQFRNMKASAGFGAHQGAYRIFLIPNAERMTPQAANSVLKLLEEPPAGWIFFLTANDPTLLLPTIVSRCQRLRLKPFGREAMEELLGLSGVPKDRRAVCARLAQGSWSRGLSLSEDEAWEQRKNLFAFLRNPSELVNPLIDWAASQPSHFELLLDQLEQICADLVRMSLSPLAASPQGPEGFDWENRDGAKSLGDHVRAVTRKTGSIEAARAFWLERGERLARARQESLAPVNRKILLQDTLMPWLAGVSRSP